MPGEAPDRKTQGATTYAEAAAAQPVYHRENVKIQPAALPPSGIQQPVFGIQEPAMTAAPVAAAPVAAAPVAAAVPSVPISSGLEADAAVPIARPGFIYRLRFVPVVQRFYRARMLPRLQRWWLWAKNHPLQASLIALSLLMLPFLLSSLFQLPFLASRLPFMSSLFRFGGLFGRREAVADVNVNVHTHGAGRYDHTAHHHKDSSTLGAAGALSGALGVANSLREKIGDAMDIGHIAKDGAGAIKDAAGIVAGKARDTLDSVSDKLSDAKDAAGSAAGLMMDRMKESVKDGMWERTKGAAGGVVDRILHPGSSSEVDTGASSSTVRPVINVNVHLDEKGRLVENRGLFGRLRSFFSFDWTRSFSPLNWLSLFALMAIPLYMWYNRRRAIAVAARPQVVPVVRPVGYTVVGGGASGAPAGGIAQQNVRM